MTNRVTPTPDFRVLEVRIRDHYILLGFSSQHELTRQIAPLIFDRILTPKQAMAIYETTNGFSNGYSNGLGCGSDSVFRFRVCWMADIHPVARR